MPSAGSERFWHGARFTFDHTFPDGTVILDATVGVDRAARVVLLWDVVIESFPGGRIEIGAASVRQLVAQICTLAAAEGFDTLIVNGYRIAGANPNRFVEIPIDCRRFRIAPRPPETPDPT